MQHRIDMAEFGAREALVELALVEVVAQLRAEQVAVLGAVGHLVDRDHVVDADGIQPVHEVAADESRSAGDDDSHANSSS